MFTSVSDRNEITLNYIERSFNVTECSESQSIVQNHHENVRYEYEHLFKIIKCEEQLKEANKKKIEKCKLTKKNKEINAL